MKSFDPEITEKKIVMLSDYVDPEMYTAQELENEQEFISLVQDQLSQLCRDFQYVEVKNMQEIAASMLNQNRDNTIIINWCEEVDAKVNSAHLVTEFLEKNDIIFTGADTKCILTTYDKAKCKEILRRTEVNTPEYVLISNRSQLDELIEKTASISFPVIIKLNNQHGSKGMTIDNIVYDVDTLEKKAKEMLIEFDEPLLIEEFIEGDEYTVPVWNNGENAEILPITKIIYEDTTVNQIYTEVAKFNDLSDEYANTKYSLLEEDEEEKFMNAAGKDILYAYESLGFKDYGRFELRLRGSEYYFIDFNSNPALGLDCSLFDGTKARYGYNFGESLLKICEFALHRMKNG